MLRRTPETIEASRARCVPCEIATDLTIDHPRSKSALCVVRYFLHVAVATHSHGAPGVFR
jgi:hypothetical protein